MSEVSESDGRQGRDPRKFVGGEFARYFAVSGVGFVVDFISLAALVELAALPLLIANSISFTLGMIAVYLGSVLWVFDRRRLASARSEFVIFCAIGVAVLAVNHAALIGAVDWLGVPYYIAKVIAAGASFVANFVIRKVVLFT